MAANDQKHNHYIAQSGRTVLLVFDSNDEAIAACSLLLSGIFAPEFGLKTPNYADGLELYKQLNADA